VFAVDLVKDFISLVALLNPIGAIPLFLSLTASQSSLEKRRTIRVASFSVAVVLAVSATAGERIIHFFGISVGSLQVGGGIVMLLMAISMVHAQAGNTRSTSEERHEAELKDNVAVVPLAIPLMAGPGTISAVIIYAGKASGWLEIGALIGVGAALGGLTFVALSLADPIARWIGRTGINITTRLMGLILSALAVEFIVNGLKALLPGLGPQT
jgi:multiple antibiotic resistance protein